MYLISVLFGRSRSRDAYVYEWVVHRREDGTIITNDKGEPKKSFERVNPERTIKIAVLDAYADAVRNENRYHEIRHFNAGIRWLAIHEASTVVVSAFLILVAFLS